MRRRWDPTVSACGAPGDHTHTHRAQGTRSRGKPSTKLNQGLGEGMSPEQQLHSRRGSGPTLDKSLGFTLYLQEKTTAMEGALGRKALPAPGSI